MAATEIQVMASRSEGWAARIDILRCKRVHPLVGQTPESATHRAEARIPRESTPRAYSQNPKPIDSGDKPAA